MLSDILNQRRMLEGTGNGDTSFNCEYDDLTNEKPILEEDETNWKRNKWIGGGVAYEDIPIDFRLIVSLDTPSLGKVFIRGELNEIFFKEIDNFVNGMSRIHTDIGSYIKREDVTRRALNSELNVKEYRKLVGGGGNFMVRALTYEHSNSGAIRLARLIEKAGAEYEKGGIARDLYGEDRKNFLTWKSL